MSLIHWWPLNGDTKDYGCGTSVTLNFSKGNTFNNSGKIGKCIDCDTVGSVSVQLPELVGTKVFTVVFWAYCYGATSISGKDFSSQDWANLFAFGDGASGSHIRFESAYGSGHERALSFHNNSANAFFNTSGNTILAASTYDSWQHVAFVCDGTSTRIYVNGVWTVGLANNVKTDAVLDGRFFINNEFNTSTGYGYHGKLSDFRIYDHALSVKEVREISKGLMLHYNFENYYQTSTRNVYALTNVVKGNLTTAGQITKTGPFTDIDGSTYYTYKINYTGTGSNVWPNLKASHFAFTIDKRYYYSCDIRIRECSNVGMYLRAARYDNDWIAPNVKVVAPSLADGEWHRREVSTIIPETFVRSGETLTSNPQLEFYTDSLSSQGTVYTCEFDLKNLQVAESDYSVPFVDSSAENIISDNSGYGYDATITGTVSAVNDTATGEHSIYSPSGANYIISKNSLLAESFNASQTFTFNIWMKIKSYVGTGFNLIFRIASTSVSAEQHIYLGYKSNKTITISKYSDDVTYSFPVNIGEWNMITLVGYKENSSAKHKLYINGIETNSGVFSGLLNLPSSSKLMLFYDVYRNGSPSDLYISDFKIYSTALSSNDIMLEYNRKASIDKNGNIYSGEFSQTANNISLPTKTSIVKANHFVEGGNKTSLQESYTELEYIESTGSQYIDTGYNHSTSTSRYEFDLMMTRFPGTYHTIFGSRITHNGNEALYLGVHKNGHTYSCIGGNKKDPLGATINLNVKYSICVDSKIGVIVNGVTYSQPYSSSQIFSTCTDYIFGGNFNGNFSEQICGRIYNFKIYNGTNLIRDFIPAKRKSDNILGLYDIVNKQFYTNQGTGTFTAGPELNKLNVIYTNQLKEI